MTNNVIMILCAAVILGLIIAEDIVSKRIGNKLTQNLYAGDYDAYDKLRNKGTTKYLIHPFNLRYMDLNRHIIQGNEAEVEESLEVFDNMRLSKRQRAMVYRRTFYYYVLRRNEARATRYYRLMKDLNNEDAMKDMNIFYDTFINKGYTYLEEMLETLKTVPDHARSDYESVISQMYENKGDMKNAKKYQDQAERHFKLMEKATKAQWSQP